MIRTSILVLALAVGVSCARAKLSPGFGKSNHAYFRAQAANPEAKVAKPVPMGLDSHEAKLIKGTYNKGLSKATEEAPKDDILILQKSDGHGGFQPAPMGGR